MNKKSPILIIGNFLSKHTGAFGVCEDLALHLQREGWPVIISSFRVNKWIRHLEQLWVTISQKNRYCLATIDIFSGRSFYFSAFLIIILRVFGKPVVLILHGGNLPNLAKQHPQLVRWGINKAEFVVAPSMYLGEEMELYCDEIQIIPNAIDVSNYQFKQRTNVISKLVWLRAFHDIYNPELAPKVIKRLLSKFPDAHLLMIGPDKNDGSLLRTKELSEKLGLNEYITFNGHIPKTDVPLWMNKGDIYINTTNIDNTPVTIIEAMACGLCIVSTNVGGIPYLLEHEKNALLVPPDDPDAMAEAVFRLLTEPGLSARLSNNARRKIEKFDWSVVLQKWETLFYQVLDTNGNKDNSSQRNGI